MRGENYIFAKRIQELRNEWGLTQEEMAQMVELRKTAISNYETGYTTPTINTLKRFMKVFGKPASYFLPDYIEDSDLTVKKAQIIYGTAIHYFDPENIEGLRSGEPALMDSTLTLPAQQHLARAGYIASEIRDNSMNLAGIKKGSCIIINTERKYPADGEIFAAILSGELIVRKYRLTDNGAFMIRESSRIPKSHSAEKIPVENFEILGTIDRIITAI